MAEENRQQRPRDKSTTDQAGGHTGGTVHGGGLGGDSLGTDRNQGVGSTDETQMTEGERRRAGQGPETEPSG